VSGKGTATFIRYRAELVPAVWLMTRRRRSRIFQDMSIPDIVKAVLRMAARRLVQAVGTVPPAELLHPVSETDYAFISRLMEEEGICFYFANDSEA